jgi:hypothetical protein
MNETENDHDRFVIDVDGRQSDPITPLPLKVVAQLAKIRKLYIKAGLVNGDSPKSPQPSSETK